MKKVDSMYGSVKSLLILNFVCLAFILFNSCTEGESMEPMKNEEERCDNLQLNNQTSAFENYVIVNEYNAVKKDEVLKSEGQDLRFGLREGNGGNWFELVVVGDGKAGTTIDMRDWQIVVSECDGLRRKQTLILSDNDYWNKVIAGTILTFRENNDIVQMGINIEDNLSTQGWIWTNIWSGNRKFSSGDAEFSTSNDNTQIAILDSDGKLVFGPVGEGIKPKSGIGKDEIFMLDENPIPKSKDDMNYKAGYESTFGKPNPGQSFDRYRIQ